MVEDDGSKQREAENKPLRPLQPYEIQAAKEKLEQLLSQERLAKDAFIQQNMNAQMYIALSVLVRHRFLECLNLNGDSRSLLAAAYTSDKLEVGEKDTHIRPVIKPRRNTLILRDLPEGIEEAELRELFSPMWCSGQITSVRPDVNCTAYVTFETEEAAQEAALWLRSQKLRGEAVKCAVKSEHVQRGFFPAAPPAQSYPPWLMPPNGKGAWGMQYGMPPMGKGANGAMVDFAKGDKGKGKEGKGKGKEKKGKGKGKGKDAGSIALAAEATGLGMPVQRSVPPSPALGPGVGSDMGGSIAGVDTLLEDNEGYAYEYRKYTRAEIVAICSSMTETPKPDGFAAASEQGGVTFLLDEPCREWAPEYVHISPAGPSAGSAPRKGSGWSHSSMASTGGAEEDWKWNETFSRKRSSWTGGRSGRTWSGSSWDDQAAGHWEKKSEGTRSRTSSQATGTQSNRQTPKWVVKTKPEAGKVLEDPGAGEQSGEA
eukprot:TRINITY_DN6046_c0_g1_i1.p1 TRINITY_DN6046_c0_g1~~TRINITY_DN6046_c0_g1_i1.p1  ORF type:complete len:485 (+),score=147.59 TRINITY_DN6046_c0_g1_i1:78-1532(+)